MQKENIIGILFMKKLENNDTSDLAFSEIALVLRKLEPELRKIKVYLEGDILYSIINRYKFFQLSKDRKFIKLSAYSKNKYNSNKLELIDQLDSYFVAGLPMNIRDMIERTVL